MVMKVDWFTASIASSNTEATPEVLSFMEECAEDFLRCGGSPTWDQYRSMSPETKAAFRRAKSNLLLEQAAAIAAIVSEWKPVEKPKTPESQVEDEVRAALVSELRVP